MLDREEVKRELDNIWGYIQGVEMSIKETVATIQAAEVQITSLKYNLEALEHVSKSNRQEFFRLYGELQKDMRTDDVTIIEKEED